MYCHKHRRPGLSKPTKEAGCCSLCGWKFIDTHAANPQMARGEQGAESGGGSLPLPPPSPPAFYQPKYLKGDYAILEEYGA